MKDISTASLKALAQAALENADALLQEANALLTAEHFARAYFLAVASIEEMGKASIAFTSSGRNLSDRSVERVVRKKLLDHKSKIIAAFAPSLQLTDKANLHEAVKASMGLIGDLRRGREPSMYTEILVDGSVRQPSSVVRPVAARDVVRLTTHCLARAQAFMASNQPPKTSHANDFFFTKSAARIQEIMSSDDFSEFYLQRIESGDPSLEDAIYAYVTRAAA